MNSPRKRRKLRENAAEKKQLWIVTNSLQRELLIPYYEMNEQE